MAGSFHLVHPVIEHRLHQRLARAEVVLHRMVVALPGTCGNFAQRSAVDPIAGKGNFCCQDQGNLGIVLGARLARGSPDRALFQHSIPSLRRIGLAAKRTRSSGLLAHPRQLLLCAEASRSTISLTFAAILSIDCVIGPRNIPAATTPEKKK